LPAILISLRHKRSPGKSTLGGSLDALCDRKQLLKNWDDVVKQPRPKLEFQGSDTFLKKQWKYCSHGEIGWFQIKHIVSALPEMDERPISTRRKITLNGWEREEEEEERNLPTTREQLKRAHLVFRNTLLMCLSSFPQFTQFNVQFQDLEDWYRFFWGKDIADRKPPSSETMLLYAESQKGKSWEGTSKGKDTNWPKNWATATPRGLQYCKDHLLRNKCPGNCGRSHGCPVIKDGWTCNGNHPPDQCPNK
jgi:hypothetical protein